MCKIFSQDQIMNTATFSDDEVYRYGLTRQWGDDSPEKFIWIMLNPSTADTLQDDPTIRRCISFTKREGYGGCMILNLFAFRATNPKMLLETNDPVGPDNNFTLSRLLSEYSDARVVCAWGTKGGMNNRNRQILRLLKHVDIRPECLGKTKDGHPKHPLYVAATTPFEYMET